ncbi:hypothetical protein CA834_08965 [Winogradskyella aurantia]|uniref:Uncharacterized protein n=2 Tax=Winogradskyella aurantia TaxID=1915063 RepID=A0A265UTG3_9FLAO|nr:hypothetical protein CA834_08965 [Winogradskyella aurantia]
MSYRYTIILFFLVSLISHTQSIDLSIANRKQFVSVKSLPELNPNDISEKIILPEDTLVYIKQKFTSADLDYYCKCIENEEIANSYYAFAFTKRQKGFQNDRVTQWNADIILFIDKKIPKNVQKDFKKFIKPISNLKNLKINYSKDPLNSNYHIIASDTSLKIYKNDKDSLDIEHALSGATYQLISDSNDKYYSAKLSLDIDATQDSELLLKKMKQLFFLSLAQFQIGSRNQNDSLLSLDYNNSENISSYDIAILKLHYIRIHDYPFTKKDFSTFYKKLKPLCSE